MKKLFQIDPSYDQVDEMHQAAFRKKQVNSIKGDVHMSPFLVLPVLCQLNGGK